MNKFYNRDYEEKNVSKSGAFYIKNRSIKLNSFVYL